MSNFPEESVFTHLQKTIRSQMNEYADHISGGDVEQRKGLVSELVTKLRQERGWRFK